MFSLAQCPGRRALIQMHEKSPFFSYLVKPKGGVGLFRKKKKRCHTSRPWLRMHSEPPSGRRGRQAGSRWALQQDSPPTGRNKHATETGSFGQAGKSAPQLRWSGLRELEGFSRERPTGVTGRLGEGRRPLRRTTRLGSWFFSNKTGRTKWNKPLAEKVLVGYSCCEKQN